MFLTQEKQEIKEIEIYSVPDYGTGYTVGSLLSVSHCVDIPSDLEIGHLSASILPRYIDR